MSDSYARPKVSVVMGVYNGARAVTRTIESVLNQRGCDFELIVVDDGSTDETASALAALARDDSRMRVISQQRGGLTRALILGCSSARGQLIARQDCGDVSLPGRLAALVDVFERFPEVSLAWSATRYFSDEGLTLFDSAPLPGELSGPIHAIDLSATWGIRAGPSHHGAAMFRRDVYERAGGYRADFYYGQDWDLWYRLAEMGKFCALPDVLYQASLAEGDISLTNKARQEMIGRESLRALKLRQENLSDEPALAAARQIRPGGVASLPQPVRGAGAYFLGEALRRSGHHQAARQYLARALAARPSNWRAWVRYAQTYLP